MKQNRVIESHSVHLWQVFVPDLLSHKDDFLLVLNQEEIKRAERFRFDEHRERYIIARAILRHILSLYTNTSPSKIEFVLGARGKPYLSQNALNLQFNVSHSHDMAVYALTTHAEIGIDIERIEPHFTEGVAKRFFSEKEYAALMALSEKERIPAFYRLWAGKEAVIKALGEGLYAPLADFSLDLSEDTQTILLGQTHFYVKNFAAHPDYQAAFATPQHIHQLVHWEWNEKGPVGL